MVKSEKKQQTLLPFTILLVLVATLSVVGITWAFAKRVSDDRSSAELSRIAERAERAVTARLVGYQEVLSAFRAFYFASENVSAEEWNRFAATVTDERRHPGMAGVGLIRIVNNKEVGEYVQAMRLEQGGDFKMSPEGEREEYYPTTYFAPNSALRGILGYDIRTEPRRREAAERARATGELTISAPVKLVMDRSDQAGFLVFLPVRTFKKGQIDQFYGWIFARFRANDVFANIFKELGMNDVRFTIHENPADESSLIFDSNKELETQSEFVERRPLTIGGRTWLLTARPNAAFVRAHHPPLFILWGGALIALLVSALAYSLQTTGVRAQRIADQLATDYSNAKGQAEAATVAKSEFLANMSHELRTPLTAIVGFSEAMLDESLSQEEKSAGMQSIMRNGHHLLSVINDILDVSKIEAGKLDLELLEVSLFDLVSDVGNLMRLRAVEKGLSFSFEYMFPVPKLVVTDITRVKQILFNLIGNAIKFTKSGAVKVVISYRQEDNQLLFAVVDTGIGLTPEQVGRLFKAFSQADASTTREFGGSGLGLVISGELAKRLGGRVTVESSVGRGSTFELSIDAGEVAKTSLVHEPIAEVAFPATKSSNSPQPVPAHFSGRVLVAEDGPDNQQFISFLLRRNNVEFTMVDNGARAVDLASKEPFDLILMDMQMPVMDGFSATAALRKLGYNHPIIALTANVMSTERERFTQAGCDGYLGKPFSKQDFLEVLSRYLTADTGFAPNESPLFSSEVNMDEALEIIRGFIKEFANRVAEVESAFRLADWSNVAMFSHRLRGAGLFGFPGVGMIAARIEAAAAMKDVSAAESALRELHGTISTVEGADLTSIGMQMH